MKIRARFVVVPLLCVATATVAVVLFVTALHKPLAFAQRKSLLAIAREYPNYTTEQRLAVFRELQQERNPHWRDLSLAELGRRLLIMAASSTAETQAPLANLQGNVTAINAPAGDLLALFRQANCSLTEDWASYSLSFPNGSYTIEGTTPNYDQVLHKAAELTTTGGKWPSGCGDPVFGITARKAAYLGTTSSGNLAIAAVGFDFTTQAQVIFTFLGPVASSNVTVGVIPISGESPVGAIAANLSGATTGMRDLVTVNEVANTGGTGSVSVIPVDATGTFGSPTNYSLPGTAGASAVVDDFNGDGKPDIIASSVSSGTTSAWYLSFLAGKGDGTFAAPVSVTLPMPSTGVGDAYFGLISTDLLGNGKKDLVTANGIILLGNGDGTFTVSPTNAFAPPGSTSEFGPNVIAADFNKDGKMDLAVANGESIQLYLGKGDGTFTPGAGYAAIDNTGYLNASDLDGDGNVDIYSGLGQGGGFGGDNFETGQGYALMSNGDGTFQGAPALPFVYTGSNLIDLNGDKVPDGVGFSAPINTGDSYFTSYLGKKNGTFTTGSVLDVTNLTYQGTSYPTYSIDSFALGDFNSDGKADLAFLPTGTFGPGLDTVGIAIATGNGDGTFNTPVLVPVPSLYPNDAGLLQLRNLFSGDLNGDGKPDLVYGYTDTSNGTNYAGLAVQYGNGDGTFKAPVLLQVYSGTGIPSTTAQPTLLGDTRSDGRMDLFAIITNFNSTTDTDTFQLGLFLNNGDGTFAAMTTPPAADSLNLPSFGAGIGQVALADMNGDGKPDLVTLGNASTGEAELAISLGNGDGTFQKPTLVDFGGGSSDGYGLAVADFDGDGKMDVAVTGFNPPFDTGIFQGNGDGTVKTSSPSSGFVAPSLAIDLLGFGAASAVDINGDGKPDLVTSEAILLNLGAASTGGTLTATTTALTVSPNPATTGQSVTFSATVTPASGTTVPTGSITFMNGSTQLGTGTLNASGQASFSTTTLAAGTYSVTAVYSGDTNFSGSTSSAVSLTVSGSSSLTATTTALTVSPNPATAGQSVAFSAKVTPASGTAVPTGTVTFMNGSTQLGTGTLNASGQASFSTSTLAAGTYSVTAFYGGDTNFSGSTSSAVSLTVNSATQSGNYTLSLSASTLSVSPGQSGTLTLSVTPQNGFSQSVAFACSGLPSESSCAFSPTTVTPSGTAAATTTMTVTTTAPTTGQLVWPFAGGGLTFACSLLFFRRRRSLVGLACLVVLAGLGGAALGCGGHSKTTTGGNQGTPTGNSTVTVTATAGTGSSAITQTTTFTLTVQ